MVCAIRTWAKRTRPGGGRPTANETGAVRATYQPAYAARTRKATRPEPRARTFPGPVDRALVQAFPQDEAQAKRAREEARAAGRAGARVHPRVRGPGSVT